MSSISKEHRADINFLEVGSGSGANLWMIAQQGCRTIGLDISKKA